MKYWILLIVLLFLIIYLTIDTVPPYAHTDAVMAVLKRRIELYVKTNNKLPDRLNNLPESPKSDNSLIDSWDRPIIYDYDSTTGMVSLTSCGEKGDCRCENDEDCIIRKFKINFH